MYVQSIFLENFRNFRKERVCFNYPESGAGEWGNINLIIGDNGSGKTTLMRAMATAILAELLPRYSPRYMVRQQRASENLETSNQTPIQHSELSIHLTLNKEQDQLSKDEYSRKVQIHREMGPKPEDDPNFLKCLYKENEPCLFLAGYGATRWTPAASQYDVPEARNKRFHIRFQRIASIFEDTYGLMPLEAWWPDLMFRKPQLAGKIGDLIQRLTPSELKTDLLGSIAVEDQFKVKLPMSELSDGYRSYLAWIFDLAYHLASVSNTETDFSTMTGVVFVDEIDLHLHPKWQQKVLRQISELLPKIQFIVTSHSPLLASTLPAENIFVLERDAEGFPKVSHPQEEIQGLDADQILRNQAFGL